MLSAWSKVMPSPASRQSKTTDVNTTTLIRDLWAKRQAVRQATAQVRNLLGPQGFHGASFRVCAALFAEWRAQAATLVASRQLQKHCKQQKRHQVEDLIAEATAGGSSLTGLHRIMRRIAPKTPRRCMQLRSPAGELLSPIGQLKLINGHFSKVYAQRTRAHPSRSPTFQVSVAELTEAIRSVSPARLYHTTLHQLLFGA